MNYVLKKGDTIATVKISAKLVGVLTALNVKPTSIKSYPLSSQQLLVAMDCISNFRPEVRPAEKEVEKLTAAFKQGYTLCKTM